MISFRDDENNYLAYGGDDFSFTKEAVSFANGYKIKGDISTSFDLPGTAENRQKLGYSSSMQINNPAFSKIAFNLLKNGTLTIRGFIVIQEDQGAVLNCIFISGNANWFRALDFSCNEISDDFYKLSWDNANVVLTRAATSGIIFPWVDWGARGNKYDAYFNFAEPTNIEGLRAHFPCLYISTMIEQIAKTANIRINGTLFSDRLYKKLIITPNGPDFTRKDGTLDRPLFYADTIKIEDIAPSMSASDFIKWLCVSFGCVPTFDEFSQTLTLNILDRIEKEDAEDWSTFYVSHTSQYYKVFQTNTIGVNESEDPALQDYNVNNEVPYGAVRLETEKDDGSEQELYTSPFAPARDSMSDGPANAASRAIAWGTAYVPFYIPEDEDGIPFTSVSDDGSGASRAAFNGAGGFPVYNDGPKLFRVVSDNGLYTGYHYSRTVGSSTVQVSAATFVGTSTGTLYPQNVNKGTGHYVLVCLPDLAVSSQSSVSQFFIGGGPLAQSSVPTAYFHKPHYPGLTALDANRNGLAYGQTTDGRDNPLTDIYWGKLQKMLSGPVEQCMFILPEPVYRNYSFNKFIYLETETLNGYFFVQKIENYIDSTTPVRCELYHVD